MPAVHPNKYKVPLNAIAQSRQYALLMMDLWNNHQSSPMQFQPYQSIEHDQEFYAQAADLEAPRGTLHRLTTAMGVKDLNYLSRLRALLRLPDEVWVLADDYNWTETQLRPLTQIPANEAINRARYWAGLPPTDFIETDSFADIQEALEKFSNHIEELPKAGQLRIAQLLKKMMTKIERDVL
jgi:hypothetical protein